MKLNLLHFPGFETEFFYVLGNRINSSRVEGMTSGNPLYSQNSTIESTVTAYCLQSIFRASRMEAAGWREKRRN